MKNTNKKTIILLFTYTLFFSCFATTKDRIISGVVKDYNNGEVLIGVSIFEKKSGNGTVTDNQGHYILWISANCDSVEIDVSYIGYTLQSRKPSCKEINIDWKLQPRLFNLNEIVVSSNVRKAIDPLHPQLTIKKTVKTHRIYLVINNIRGC